MTTHGIDERGDMDHNDPAEITRALRDDQQFIFGDTRTGSIGDIAPGDAPELPGRR